VVTLTLNLSEAVTVAGGTPTLTLNDGGTATYTGGSGTNALTFSYTVAGGQSTADLAVTAVNLGTATVKDGAGNAANLSGAVTSPAGTLQIDGITTHVAQVGSNYFLDNIKGSGPELKYGGAVVTAGEFAGWTPIAAVEVAGGGYDIAWKNTSAGLYTVWSTDSNGNYTSNVIGAVSGTSTALEALETTFNQDLNGDGTIGIPKVVIQTDGSTVLTGVGNNFFLNSTGGGTGPELSYGGAAVTTGEFAGWTAIGAVQVAGGGYDIAWKNASAGLYTVWSTDSNGNYTSNVIGAVSGSSTALETLENTFQQDLNGDGVVGIYAAPGTTLQISNSLSGPSGSATIGAGATLELAATNSSSVTFTSSTGSLELDQPSTFDGVIFGFTGNGTLSGSDQIDLKGISFSNIHDSYSNGVLTVSNGTQSAELDFNGSYVLANFEFASDGKGGTIVYDPPVTGQASNAAANTTNNPAVSALNQQVALFTQQIAAAFPSSSAGDASSPTGSASELTAAQLTQLTTPVANQQHA
jgi:hypothetical protein